MSWLSKYVFDPVLAALARAAISSNAGVAAAAKATQTSLNASAAKVGGDLQAGLTANSAAAVDNDIIAGLENGLQAAVNGFCEAAIPVVGGEVAAGADVVLAFAEQHAATYLASLFAHAKAQTAAAQTTKTS